MPMEPAHAAPTMEPLTTSPTIEKIAEALARAQAKVAGASKDSKNPFFDSKYADLASVWSAMRDAYTSEGIAVVQIPNGGGEVVKIEIYDKEDVPIGFVEGVQVRLTTLLVHSSGQWIGGTCTMTSKDRTPQAHGSCLTYLRRYALSAVGSVAPEDDDGNGAGRRVQPQDPTPARRPAARPTTPPPTPAPRTAPANDAAGPKATPEQLNEIVECFKILDWALPHQRSWVKKHANVQSLRDLGAAQAADLIERLAVHLHEKVAEQAGTGAA